MVEEGCRESDAGGTTGYESCGGGGQRGELRGGNEDAPVRPERERDLKVVGSIVRMGGIVVVGSRRYGGRELESTR